MQYLISSCQPQTSTKPGMRSLALRGRQRKSKLQPTQASASSDVVQASPLGENIEETMEGIDDSDDE